MAKEYVVMGAKLECNQATAPSNLVVLPVHREMLTSQLKANIGDAKPFVNVLPFGLCKSMANPAVAAATSANRGTLTPMPCTPACSMWIGGKTDILLDGMPMLMVGDITPCPLGVGKIEVMDSGQGSGSKGGEVKVDPLKAYFDAMRDDATSPLTIGSNAADGGVAALAVFGAKALSMPSFETVMRNGVKMVKVFDSPNYSGGRGGLRFVQKSNLLSRPDNVGKAFRFDNSITKISNGLIVIGGALSFADEYQKGANLPQKERIVNASVEGAWSVGTAVAIGAAVGSIVPGAGTVAGAAIGFVVGATASVLINGAVNAKWFDDGKSSAMDKIKEGTNIAVDAIADIGAKAGNAIASWLKPKPALGT